MSKFEKEDVLRDGAGFIFQTLVRAKKSRRPPSKPTATQMTAALGRIGGVVRRRPEVMVKVTGSAHGFRAMREHLAYITRKGKLIGEREDGTLIEGATNVRSLAEEWWDKSGVDRPARARDTINVILSMPIGTDPGAVADAARAFARKTFGEHYDYLLAHHNKESDPKRPENPHAHLTIRTKGRDGQRLDPRKHDLQAWREAFALELRERGVIAEATQRRVRGITRKGQRQAIRHLDARKAARVTKWKLTQAVLTASKGNDGAAEPWRRRQRRDSGNFAEHGILSPQRSSKPDNRSSHSRSGNSRTLCRRCRRNGSNLFRGPGSYSKSSRPRSGRSTSSRCAIGGGIDSGLVILQFRRSDRLNGDQHAKSSVAHQR